MVAAIQKEKAFGKHLEVPGIERSPEKIEKLRLIERYMRKIFAQWDFQCTVQEIGFSVKSVSIQTRWYITADLMRTSLQTFLLTLLPSISTYYVKSLQN
jgi:hypothetical protein